ncbi:hypothetical protein BaRGS_00021510, partial [Batillaria attramentaria]
HFEFPTVTNAVVTAKEGANITLPFTLRDVGCIGSSEYSIVVGQAAGTGIQTPDVICQIHVIDSVCRSYTGLGCSCLQGRGRFQLDKTVNRSDNGTLLLFYFGGFQEQVVRGLIFNILYTEESNVPVVAGASVAAVAAILTVSVTVFICVRR